MLTREDLQRAKARLRKFAVVMMLDHFDEDSVQLAESLGWTQFEELYSDASDTLSSPFSEEQLQTLANINSMDFELVCYARSLARCRSYA